MQKARALCHIWLQIYLRLNVLRLGDKQVTK
jgi:hypothetical protein